MQILLTVCSLIGAIVSVAYCFAAARERLECENHAKRLALLRATVTGHDGDIPAIQNQLNKLRGQFHAFKREVEEGPPVEPRPEPRLVDGPLAAEFCANYGQAQVEGPLSAAARCECGYCVEMRARRDQFRAAAVPRTATGQAKLARLNAGKSDGE